MKQKSNIQISSFDDPGFSRLIELTKTSFDESEICQPGYLGWEYVLNPNGEALIEIAEADKKIASQYVVLPREFFIDGKLYRGSVSVNSITDPVYHGDGLFSILAEKTFDRCTDENISFTIGVPDGSQYSDFRDKLGFRVLGRLPLLFRSFQPVQTVLNFIRREPSQNEIGIPFGRGTVSIDQYRISKFDPVADRHMYEEFFAKFHSLKIHATARTLEYLRWRYFDIPMRKYLMFKLCRDKKMLGYVVYRARHVLGCRCGIVVDICSIDHDIPGWRFLMEVIDYISRSNKIDFLFATVPVHSYEYMILKRSGYSRLLPFFMTRSLPLIIRPHKKNLPSTIMDFKRWFFTFGDYDVY